MATTKTTTIEIQQIKLQPEDKKQLQQSCPYTYASKSKSPSLLCALRGLIPTFNLITSIVCSILRLFAGTFADRRSIGKRPSKLLRLYDIEGDPECRRVREALTTLDLECVILPCPRGGNKYRAEALKLGGKETFPLLVDENASQKIYNADAIIAHLYKNYGNGKVPFIYRHPLVRLFSFIASLFRGFRGMCNVSRQQETRKISDPTAVELWSYEGSPHCRLVREVLCELEVPYLLHNVGKRSPSRVAFVERSGRMMVPYIVDANKDNVSMFESEDIIRYLYSTYAH